MKKLLLLFIPLVFFFSCENEEEESANCSCGEVIDTIDIDESDGNVVPVLDADGNWVLDIMGNQVWELVGQHERYTIGYIENECDGSIGLTYEDVVLGQSVCLDNEYIWSDITVNSQMDENCDNTIIDENNRCGIIVDIMVYQDPNAMGLGGVELILENCLTNKIGTACIMIYDDEDFSAFTVGELYCTDFDFVNWFPLGQSFWSNTIGVTSISSMGTGITIPVSGCFYESEPSSYLSFVWPDN